MSSSATSSVSTCKLVSRHEVAERTMAFRFEKPAGWTFKAGQFIDMTLLAPFETDAEGNTRGFSIASAPQEDTLMVATRLRDTAFKRVLKTMPFGAMVKIEGHLAISHSITTPSERLCSWPAVLHHTIPKHRVPRG
jgi:ferredoxin-NADP reductase